MAACKHGYGARGRRGRGQRAEGRSQRGWAGSRLTVADSRWFSQSAVWSRSSRRAPGGTPRPVSRGSAGPLSARSGVGPLWCLFGGARPRSSSVRKPAPGSRRFAAERADLGLSGACQSGALHSGVFPPTWCSLPLSSPLVRFLPAAPFPVSVSLSGSEDVPVPSHLVS